MFEGVDFVLELLFDFCERVSHSLATCSEKNDAEFGRAELRQEDIIRWREMGGQGEGEAGWALFCKFLFFIWLDRRAR
jgi:hypothetical protein